ncbi:hypothetical protein J2X11_000797 [Aeromicrobium panaciterrae]|uniref:TetR family transcriptional regulator n=1 Tax=Aeromicrobium panaciterrae TaxID=363861 RepID=A0ABU1ULA6_9ACTN|nr:hypothetical protein [Aeromicrobium panaciterrae]MDR7085958.1 hypothetical protein [Aeromicrobium panaciterrae]
MSAEAWDEVLDTIDHLAVDPEAVLDGSVEQAFATLILKGIENGTVDGELHVDDTARWLCAILVAHRAARDAHPDVAADDDLAVLRLIVTRWLHPHRLAQRESEPRT